MTLAFLTVVMTAYARRISDRRKIARYAWRCAYCYENSDHYSRYIIPEAWPMHCYYCPKAVPSISIYEISSRRQPVQEKEYS